MISRKWCGTLNNYTEDEYTGLTSELSDKTEYGEVGREIGEVGSPHIQMFFVFNTNQRMAALKRINGRAHWEMARGTCSQAGTYCKKDNNFIEWGECPADSGGAGNKARWDHAKSAAMSGDLETVDSQIFIQHYGNLQRIRDRYIKPPEHLPVGSVCGVWIVGEKDAGKSHYARETIAGGKFFDKPLNKWWDGYGGEDNVILDDVGRAEGKWIGGLLKRWADRYYFPAEIKGYTMKIRPKKIIVTSNYDIIEVFGDDMVMQGAVMRRFEVIKFDKTMRISASGGEEGVADPQELPLRGVCALPARDSSPITTDVTSQQQE